MRFLITGLGGFAGRHLAALLLDGGDEVYGTVHRAADQSGLGELAGHSSPLRDENVHVADVADAQTVAEIVAAVRPDGIFHLAGMTFVPDAHIDPTAVFRTNALGTINVLAAVRRHQPRCRVLVVGSADAYGLVGAEDLPVREECPFRPLNPYGASKASADLIAYQWARGYDLDVVRMRPFNHTGPGQRASFVCADFASQLVEIERRRRPPRITVGNLDAVRDFSDVRDVVAAYAVAWRAAEPGDAYNVCSGLGRSVREMLATLIELIGLDVRIEVDPKRLRRTDVPAIVGSAEKLRRETGWCPRIEWRRTLADLLTDRRRRAGA
jgi:GDP-4-dehydro-6-deoxy-D-mannose reductase